MYPDLLFLGSLMVLYLFIADYSVRSGELVQMDSAKACALMPCSERGEYCLSRKFWCKNPPCPSMVYCSKTSRESLEGPMTCEFVRCNKGYICLVRVRRCSWDQGCSQQVARCVSEREYHDGPASCADVHCPSGHRCVLRESLCDYPPCKLLKSCAKTEDIQMWHDRCRTLGCPSEYECFLRRPLENCSWASSCKYTPDCTITKVEEVTVNPDCQGWVCPRHQECKALVPESCSSDDGIQSCKVNRTCHEPVDTSDTTWSSSVRLFPRMLSSANAKSYHQESSYNSGHRRHVPTPSQMNCSLNKCAVHVNWGIQLAKWNPKSGSIYRTPVYVRSTMSRNSAEARESPSEKTPTDHSITEWLDHLRLKTGVDAINVWVKQAEENRKSEHFNEWLEAVKATLGPFRFEIWLSEIQRLTSKHPAFQKWLVTNESASSLTEHQTGDGNDKQRKSFAVFPDQKGTLVVDRSQKTTESPVHDFGTSTDSFYLYQRTPNILPLRKNAGHPRINYGDNRGYKQHRDYSPSELKNEMPTWYMTHDAPSGLQTDQYKTNKSYTKIESVDPSRNYSVNQSLQPNHKTEEIVPSLDYLPVELSNQRNDYSVMNDSAIDSPIDSMGELRKHIRNDSMLEDGVQLHNLEDPLSNILTRRQEKHGVGDLMNENVDVEVPLGFNNLRQKTSDQIQNRSGVFPNVLFNRVEYPEWNSEPQSNPVSTNPRQLAEKDQRESSQVSKSPESMQRQYYQRVYELDHKAQESGAKSWNSSSDIGMKKEKDLNDTYTLFAPAADEFHIISPLDTVRVVNPEKRAYYTLVGFPQEEANDRMQIVGYPLAMSKVGSIDQANIFPQNPKEVFDIPQDPESSVGPEKMNTLNSWKQTLQHQPLPRRLIPIITQNYDYPSLEERRHLIDSKNRQPWPLANQQEQNTQKSSFDMHESRPVSAPFQNWYPWNGQRPYHLSEVSHVSELPKNSHNIGFTDLEKSLKDYYGTLSSQEYVDAYVDAVIEDALSEVILGGELQDEEEPSSLLEEYRAVINKRLKEDHLVDTVLEAQSLGNNTLKKIFTNERPDGDPTTSLSMGTVQLKDILTNEREVTTKFTTPNLSTHSNMETDYRYECEDRTRDPAESMEGQEKSSVIEETYSPDSESDEEVAEYYSEDKQQQEYFEEASRYRDEYFRDLETNLTDYDFQYYDDEE